MYKTVILPVAKQDIKEAAKWYDERQPGLGKRFTVHVRKAIQYIKQNPTAISVRYDDIRMAPLDTFPYMIHCLCSMRYESYYKHQPGIERSLWCG